MKIELNAEKEVYRLSHGDEESPDYEAGELADFGELAWLEVDGEMYFAFIASDGETDGRVYKQSAGVQVEAEPDCDFEDEDEGAAEPV